MSRYSSRSISILSVMVSAVMLIFVLTLSGCSSASYHPTFDENGRMKVFRRADKDPDRGAFSLRSRKAYKPVEFPYATPLSGPVQFDPASEEADAHGFIVIEQLPTELAAFTSTRYRVNEKRYPDTPFSSDQSALLTRLGSPDAVRAFTSLEDEKVVEWLYLQRRVVAQFCEGYLLFVGPMTDQDETLYQFGRPDYVVNSEFKDGPLHMSFVYRSRLNSKVRTFSFTREGSLVDSVR